MKRMKKKVVAMVTLAMFLMTLLPMAAFAGEAVNTDVDAAKSTYKVETTSNVGEVKVTVDLKNAAGEAAATGNETGQVKVKLTEVAKEATLAAGDATNMTVNDIKTVKDGVSIASGQYSATFTLKNVPGGKQTVGLEISTDNGGHYVPMAVEGNNTILVNGTADRQTSKFLTVDQDVNVDVNETVKAKFEINDKAGNPTVKGVELPNVVVWAVEKGHDITDASTALTPVTGSYENNDPLELSFARAGEYTLYAGVDAKYKGDLEEASKHLLGSVANHQVVVVDKVADGDVANVVLDNATVDSTDSKVYTANSEIKANNTATQSQVVTVTDKDGLALDEKEFTISTSSSNITVTAKNIDTDKAFDGNPVTNRNGQFKITYKVAKEGDYKIYLKSEDGYKVTLKVSTDDNDRYADKITNATFDASIVDKDDLKQNSFLSDSVRFVITDNEGDVLDPEVAEDKALIEKEPAAKANDDYISLTAPDKFKGEAKDFKLAIDTTEDPDVITLQYTGKHKFVVGDYTVRVALEDNGNYVDAKFTVGDFDDNAVKEIKVKPSDDTIAYNKGAEGFTFDVKAVDKNGVEKDITGTGDYTIGVNANSILEAKLSGSDKVVFKDKINVADKADYVGNVITLTAVSDKYTSIATAEVTVIDDNNDLAAGLAFDSENGAANKDNKVAVSVVDKDGKVVDGVDSDDIIVYVANQSNKDANVDVDVTKQVKDGKDGQITIYSDKETKVDVVVAVKTTKEANDAEAIYAGTLKYTIGAEDVLADTSVVMTLGSTEMIINNEVVDMKDAAPFAQDNRTYVPFRALGEALGADVEYDKDAKTVTYELGSTKIVMTLDSKTYTVNGAEKTMDVAPFAKDNRTYVPVRFVGEGLGFTVTGLTNANGQYVAVAFTK